MKYLLTAAVALSLISCNNSQPNVLTSQEIERETAEMNANLADSPPGANWQSVGEGRWIRTDGTGFYARGLEGKRWLLTQLRERLAVKTQSANPSESNQVSSLKLQAQMLEDNIKQTQNPALSGTVTPQSCSVADASATTGAEGAKASARATCAPVSASTGANTSTGSIGDSDFTDPAGASSVKYGSAASSSAAAYNNVDAIYRTYP